VLSKKAGKGKGKWSIREHVEEEEWIMCLDELKLKVRKLIFIRRQRNTGGE
jgi:hypothetical protein